jgi:hypothetical protein
VNGYGLNHTALSVHQIAGRQGDIYGYANELVMKGFKMNETGGIMKVNLIRHQRIMMPSMQCLGQGLSFQSA